MFAIDQLCDGLDLIFNSILFSSRSSHHSSEENENRIGDQNQHIQKSIDLERLHTDTNVPKTYLSMKVAVSELIAVL